MKNTAKRFFALLCAVLLLWAIPVTAHADMGPKPSVTVKFKNTGDETCYATLLSRYRSNGHRAAWDGNEKHAKYEKGTYDIWKAFVDYEDGDGFWFLQEYWDVSGGEALRWGYFPPDTFKILLYFPETDRFVVSEVLERYAFDSVFTVELSGDGAAQRMTVSKAFRIRTEAGSFLLRCLLTIGIELLVALLFGFREKKQLLCIILVNVVTQVLLNVILLLFVGGGNFLRVYLGAELLVLAAEALVYCGLLSRLSEWPVRRSRCVGYAVAANLASCVLGFVLLYALPILHL